MSQHFYRTAGQISWSLLLAVLLMPTSVSEAETVTFNFQGVVTELDVNAGLFGPGGQVLVGDPFSGHFSYEVGPGNPDQLPADSEFGVYDALEFTIDGSPLTFQNPRIGITHRFVPSILPASPISIDRFQVVVETPGASHATAHLVLGGSFGAAFMDDSLPTHLDLSLFDTARVAGVVAVGIHPAPTIDDHGTLEMLTQIPEPTTLTLVALGLFGCAVQWKRQQLIDKTGTQVTH